MASLESSGFGDLVDWIGVEVRTTRLRAARAVNAELVAMNWRIGRLILDRQQTEPWGSGVIKRLAAQLRREFPDMEGLSATNLQYMRAFAAAWPDPDAISQRPVGKLPWGHVRTLLDQLDDPGLQDWDAVNGWSREVLEHHIGTGLHRRIGAAPTDFADHLATVDVQVDGSGPVTDETGYFADLVDGVGSGGADGSRPDRDVDGPLADGGGRR